MEAEGNYPGPDGVPLREHWELAAARGNPDALAKISVPFPEALGHLWRWINQLRGRSGVGPHGINPLAYGTITEWERLTDQHPTPAEVEALLMIDAAMHYRADSTPAPANVVDAPVQRPAWPTKKGA